MKKHPAPQKKASIVAAADACDEAVLRLDMVLCLLEAFHEQDQARGREPNEYEFLLIVEQLEAIRMRCQQGADDYIKAMESREA